MKIEDGQEGMIAEIKATSEAWLGKTEAYPEEAEVV
jgi:hypothetical protein